jgi:hypothetical protein
LLQHIVKTHISNEMCYFVYLIENYALYKNESGKDILCTWQKLGIAEKIFSLYSPYHMLGLEYVCNNIDNWQYDLAISH